MTKSENINEIFEKYGYKPPKPDVAKPKRYPPMKDCFAYEPETGAMSERCMALSKMYCRQEKCHFYKPFRQFQEEAQKYREQKEKEYGERSSKKK